MKLENLLKARSVLNQKVNEQVSFDLAYKLVNFIKASNQYDAFYNEKINEAMKEFTVSSENNQIKLKEGKTLDDLNSKIDEILSEEIDFPQFYFSKFELSELKFSAIEVNNIAEFIKEE